MSNDDGEPTRRRLRLISGQNLSADEEQAVDVLDRALPDCGLTDAGKRAACLTRLLNLPDTLVLPRLTRAGLIGAPPKEFLEEFYEKLGAAFGDDHRDIKVRLLRINEGAPNENARWGDLSRAEQMRATRLWRSITESHPTDISIERKGRPAEIDSALTLYLMFVLMEALGRDEFAYSTRNEDSAGNEARRTGPMLRALMAALQFHQTVGQNIGAAPTPQVTPNGVVTRIVKTHRSAAFRQGAKRLSLRLTADGVAASPSTFRYLVAEVMRQRRHRNPHGFVTLRPAPP